MIGEQTLVYIYDWVRYLLTADNADLAIGNDLDVGSSITIGDDTDYVEIDPTNGTKLHGDATVWGDLCVPTNSLKTEGTNDPDFVQLVDNGLGTSIGVFAYHFDASTAEELFFLVQLPYSWKEGSDIYLHIHWCPTDASAGNVLWRVEYAWANIDAALPDTTTVQEVDAASGTAGTHQVLDVDTMTGTGKTHGSMIVCRVLRVAAHAQDTYAADAALLGVGFYYEINSMGDASL